MKRWNLNRVVTHAVQYALISGLSACSASALRDDGSDQVRLPGEDDATTDDDSTGAPNDTTEPTPSGTTTDVTTDTGATTDSETTPDTGTDTGTTTDSETTDTSTDSETTATSTDSETTGTTTDSETADTTTDSETTDTSTDSETTDTDTTTETTTDSLSLECSDDGDSIFDQMQLASSYDSIALRVTTQGGLLDQPPLETELSGAHCSGATDGDACLSAVENTWPTPDSSWQQCGQAGCRSFGVLTTQGDDVALAESLDAISALLGPIDTPHEASLWAQANDYSASCDDTSYRSTTNGIVLDFEQMISDCPVTYAEISLHVAPDGTLKELSRVELPETGACIGRRPPGMLGVNAPCSGFEVGDYFAEVAALEDAAVEAFDIIRSDLARFGAPETLLREAAHAQADEVRHAQQMSALAARYGATPAKHRSESKRDQTLLEFALDNAVEGCIRETFGAACAAYQAVRARDPEVRATLRQVATDETRHAELSWKIHSWVASQLTAEERAQLTAAMHAAVTQLQVEVTRAQPASVRFAAGTPGPADAAALLDDLQAQLWAPALAA